ncbi:unnamed protein product, partial [Didymodactylos carnosus]
ESSALSIRQSSVGHLNTTYSTPVANVLTFSQPSFFQEGEQSSPRRLQQCITGKTLNSTEQPHYSGFKFEFEECNMMQEQESSYTATKLSPHYIPLPDTVFPQVTLQTVFDATKYISKCFTCKVNAGIAVCSGCSNVFCRQHFNTHRQYLTDDLNAIIQKYDEKLEQLTPIKTNSKLPSINRLLDEINDWELLMTKKIRNAGDNVRQYIDNLLNQCQNKCKKRIETVTNKLRIRNTADDYDEQDIAGWKMQIDQLETLIKNGFSTVIKDIHLDIRYSQQIDWTKIIGIQANTVISLEEGDEKQQYINNDVSLIKFNFSLLETKPNDILDIDSDSYAMSTNDNLLIYFDAEHMCLFNQVNKNTRSIRWTFGHVKDICYCSSKKQFILLLVDKILTYDPVTNETKSVDVIKSRDFEHCACSGETLLFTYGNIVDEWNTTKWKLLQKWECRIYEQINCIRISTNELFIGVVISSTKSNYIRFELRDRMMNIIRWTKLQSGCSSLVSLPNSYWIVASSTNMELSIIDECTELIDQTIRYQHHNKTDITSKHVWIYMVHQLSLRQISPDK